MFRLAGRHPAGLLVLILAACAVAADSPLPGCFPPDTHVVVGVRLHNLIDALPAPGAGAELSRRAAELVSHTPLAGFNPVTDIDELFLASNGKGETPSVLVVARGTFHMEQLAAGAKRYHGVPVIESGQPAGGVIALLDASTAIAGDLATVRAAIDRRGSPTRLAPTLAARIAALRSHCQVWGIGDLPEHDPAAARRPDGFGSLDRFEFGAALHEGLKMAAEIHVASPQDAEKIAATVRLLETVMKARQPSAAGGFAMHAGNGTIKLSLVVSEDEVKKAIEAQRAAVEAGLLSQLSSPWPRSASPAPAARPAPRGTQIVTNATGDTVSVTLPGKR